MKNLPLPIEPSDNNGPSQSRAYEAPRVPDQSGHDAIPPSIPTLIPAFDGPAALTTQDIRRLFQEACSAWLARSASLETRTAYARELRQFLRFSNIAPDRLDLLATLRPHQVAAWRDHLRTSGLSNVAIVRKMTVLRSLFSYLQTYGFTGANPAHSDFVETPAVPRDGKTVALSPDECRRLLDAPDASTPAGLRDRALFAVLAYTGCRVGELCRLRIMDYKETGGHKILEIRGKGGRERRVPLHAEAVERLEAWIQVLGGRGEEPLAMFRPLQSARGKGRDGFKPRPLTRRAVQHFLYIYVRRLGLDPAVTPHSLRVTALTTARERGCDIVDLQDFAGHADPRVTLAYIRNRDRLSRSPAYVLRY